MTCVLRALTHRRWDALTHVQYASTERLGDGKQTGRYTRDDDRLVLEGLALVPSASPGKPTFF